MSYTTKDEQQFINCTLSGPVRVWVKDGKIVRILPLEYSEDDAAPWSIEARGHTFTRPNKAGIACWIQGSKQYVYSKDRLLTPVKRVDFDPDGNRNPQNRGKSAYESISWDEALDIITKEVVRIRRQYGPAAIAVTGSSHDSWGTIGYRMSAMDRFWNILGCTWIDHNPESWEGFFWGAIHAWGFYWRLGQPPAYDLLEDTFKHTDMIVFWSSDPTTTSGDYGWREARCVQSCPVSCMYFGDLDDPESRISKFLAENQAEAFEPEKGTQPSVKYVGLPKPDLAGSVIFGDKDECAKEVSVTLTGPDGAKRELRTDFFGDFYFDGLERVKYTVQIHAKGYASQRKEIEMTEDNQYLGEIMLSKG